MCVYGGILRVACMHVCVNACHYPPKAPGLTDCAIRTEEKSECEFECERERGDMRGGVERRGASGERGVTSVKQRGTGVKKDGWIDGEREE